MLPVEVVLVARKPVEFAKRRCNGAGLDPFRDQTSAYKRRKAGGRWPIRYQPDDWAVRLR